MATKTAVKEEAPPPKAEKPEKPERKIYKGREITLAELMEEMAANGPQPIQPIERKSPAGDLPPTFIATKFVAGWKPKHKVLHYFVPGADVASYRELPEDFKLNLLSGRRAGELKADWEVAKTEKLHMIAGKVGATVGADPEIFAVDSKGKVVPAWEFAGSKAKPDKYAYGVAVGDVYWDGFQAEFTTPPNLHCLMILSDAIHHGLKKIHQLAGKKNAKLSLASVVDVDPDFLNKHSEKHPEHIAFGCSPSKNVYGLQGNTKDGKDVPYRFAGGHMHFGLVNKSEPYLQGLVRALDRVLGVACVSLFAEFDSPIRRQFYGLPGEYRTPPHGLEYRVLSNAWLSHPLAYHLCFDLARNAMGLQEGGFLGAWDVKEEEAVETILAHDVKRARKLLERNAGLFQGMFKLSQGAYLQNAKTAAGVFLNGLESAVKDPGDIVKNWGLDKDDAMFPWLHGNYMFASYAHNLSQGKKV